MLLGSLIRRELTYIPSAFTDASVEFALLAVSVMQVQKLLDIVWRMEQVDDGYTADQSAEDCPAELPDYLQEQFNAPLLPVFSLHVAENPLLQAPTQPSKTTVTAAHLEHSHNHTTRQQPSKRDPKPHHYKKSNVNLRG